jgi:PBP1b-binding outer membrane lipoprotein LpoB
MKSIFTIMAITLLLSGCSNTWSGVKEDSSTIWSETKQTTHEAVQGTKEAIHKATE